MAARASGLQAIAGPYLGSATTRACGSEPSACERSASTANGRCIPARCDAINEVFTPNWPNEFERASAVIDALDRPPARRSAARWSWTARWWTRRAASSRCRFARGRAAGRQGGDERDASAVACGPWFEDFERGTVFSDAPGLTLTPGHAALHQAVAGDRLRLALDAELCREVTGDERLLAHPNLVCDVAIGQSTGPTQRVLGNLFYRGLVLARPVFVGETLRTRTEVVGAEAEPAARDGPPTGLVVMRIQTTDGGESRFSTSGAAR